MRNRYPGICYRCGIVVKANAGHFERQYGKWAIQHAECAVKYRGTDVGIDLKQREQFKERMAARQIEIWKDKAKQTGPSATKARRALRNKNISWMD